MKWEYLNSVLNQLPTRPEMQNERSCLALAGKEACFDRVIQRFGRKSTYVVIGK